MADIETQGEGWGGGCGEEGLKKEKVHIKINRTKDKRSSRWGQ